MGRRIRIPGLVDLLVIDRPGEILAVADDPALVRGGPLSGPLLNRWLQRNIRGALRIGNTPLPSALPREDEARAAAQRALTDRLNPENAPWDDESLDAIADALCDGPVNLGPLCQQAIGRLFVPEFTASDETWRAARTIDTAARNLNPLRHLVWTLTNRISRAQRTLADAANGDPSAVHATGIAVHTFVRCVENLEAVLSDRTRRRTLSAKAAIGGALAAPKAVLRSCPRDADTPAGPVAPGTLVLLQLDDAVSLTSDPRVAFLSESWSFCPAHRLVPAMLAEIWFRATGERPGPIEGDLR